MRSAECVNDVAHTPQAHTNFHAQTPHEDLLRSTSPKRGDGDEQSAKRAQPWQVAATCVPKARCFAQLARCAVRLEAGQG